ncbi:urease accessory protein UreD [Ilumatobacter sp.]|uniref:urease accessory protein UreD n=1 Tax=Ilumatobacter sp. TaxID=1967498 RepID=UPI003B52CA5A
MRARGALRVGHDARTGGSVLRSSTSAPPFAIRACAGRILISASAAAPVGGDELALDVDVDARAEASVGTVASTIVLPGPTARPSTMDVRCRVGPGGHLDWIGEPTVSVAGSDHTVTTSVDLDASASCRLVEEVSLGRSGEPSGRLRLVVRVVRGGAPVVHHDETLGPHVAGAGSAISVGAARHLLCAVVVGTDAGGPRSIVGHGSRAARLPVTADAFVVLALGAERPSVRALVRDIAPELSAPAPTTSPGDLRDRLP